MKVVIVSTYRNDIGDLDYSLRSIMCGAFTDLGHTVTYINETDDLSTVKNSRVVIMGQPKKMRVVLDKLHETNKMILYNLEPISASPEYRGTLINCAKDARVNQVWMYNDCQTKYVKGSRFIPVGWHESLLVKSTKNISNRIAFVGSNTGLRGPFIKAVRNLGMPIDLLGGSRKIRASGVDKYVFGADMEHSRNAERYRWHRLMLYTANRTVFLSTADWSKYGFVSGKHYIRCIKPADFVNAAKKLAANRGLANQIADNLLSKVRKSYNMSNLIKTAVESL